MFKNTRSVHMVMFCGAIFCGFQSFLASSVPSSKNKLVIDHDGGADDAMAVFISLLFEKYMNGPEVVGLITTNGNVRESQAFNNSQRILDVAGRRDVPIYRGANRSIIITPKSDFFYGMDGLGDLNNVKFRPIAAQKKPAVLALIDLSKRYEGKLIVLAIGPLTNIALAIKLDPGFIGRLAKLYVGAGNIFSEKYKEPEFNVQIDVEAYRILVDNATPDKVTVVPFSQVLETLNITKEWRKDVLGAIPTTIMKAQNRFEIISKENSSSWSLLDPAAAAALFHEDIAEFKYSKNSVHLCGALRGIVTNDFDSETPNLRLFVSGNENKYKKFLVDVFSAEICKSNKR